MPAPSTDDTAAQFSRQAEAYADSRTHAADEDLEILAGFAAPAAQDLCLDIATGPGHTAFRIAAAAGYVIGADIAPGMLATAARLARERGIDNAGFALTDVHALAFAPASFELVTCRIAPHHFADVAGATREVVRVLKPGGRFVVEDSLAPEEPDLAAFLDQLERRRDPTHVRSLTRAEWHQVVTDAGLTVSREEVFHKRHPFDLWVRRTGLDEAVVTAICAEILAAPPKIQEAFFEIDGDHIVALLDRKLILRADRTET